MKKLFLLISIVALSVTVNAGLSVPTPSTDFSSGYFFEAQNAMLDGDIEFNNLSGSDYLRYYDRSSNGTAAWFVSVTKPCLVSVTLNMFDNSWNYDANDDVKKLYKNGGHIFKVRIIDESETAKDSVYEALESSAYTDIALSGTLYFEKAGIYMVELLNSRAYSKCGISGITLTAVSIPETSFASAYSFVADAATLHGADGQFLLETSVTPHYIRYHDHSQPGPYVTWEIASTRACYVDVTLNFADNSSFYSGNKHIMQVLLLDGYGNPIDSIAEGPAFEGDGFTENGIDKTLAGTIKIPAAGVYIIKMLNNRNHSKTGIYGITLSYAGGAVQNMPGTTDISESGYAGGTRADGKFTIADGKQDKAWMEWNVAFANSGNYNVFLKINSDNGKKFKIALQDANKNDVVTPLEKNGGDKGTPVTLEMGAMTVPAGNYTLKLTNDEAWSDAEWISIQFVRAGGGLIDIPDNLSFDEVILSTRAWIDNDSILFTARGEEGHNSTEYAKWNIHSEGGWYKFTLNAHNANMTKNAQEEYTNGQKYTISILSSDESETRATKTSSWSNPGALSLTTDAVELPEGDYIVMVQNVLWGSCGRVLSVSATYEGGNVVDLPEASIPFADALLSPNATRSTTPAEIHFNGVDQYAQWYVHADAGLYDFTFNVTGSDYGKYQLTVIDDNENEIYKEFKGLSNSGSVTHSSILLEGDYTIRVANVNSGSIGYLTSLSATAATDVIIFDENETDASAVTALDGTSGKKPLIKRTFKGGMYNTICLPFDSYNSELEGIFGTDYELLELESATLAGDALELNFTTIAHNGSNYSAGKPYLIKPTQDVINPKFSTHTIHIYADNNTKSCTSADFVGSYVKGVIPASEYNLFLGSSNTLYFSNNDVTLKGMRAYFRVKDNGSGAPVRRARIVAQNNVVTELELINGEWQDIKSVNGTIKTIEDGQLILIRDGKRYNVMGIRF